MADTISDAPPTDGRTDETKGERTRRRLLEIAVEQFGRRGFRGTSVSEIAREAGLTQAAVYAYFDNKTALFDAAVDADADAIIRRAEAETADVEPAAPHPGAARPSGGRAGGPSAGASGPARRRARRPSATPGPARVERVHRHAGTHHRRGPGRGDRPG
ncbi:MAG: helix-turn-helix domain-containing protein [Acidimicrobiia bacterium]|nr:helix-turn-helix domain-containing protein [Acidimicrobiia bacterium]